MPKYQKTQLFSDSTLRLDLSVLCISFTVKIFLNYNHHIKSSMFYVYNEAQTYSGRT